MNLIVGLKFRPFLMYQPATVNQDPIMISLWFFTLEGVYKDDQK